MAQDAAAVNVLVDHGAYDNFGDLAMLEAAVTRLRGIDGARLFVQESTLTWPWDNVRPIAYEIRPPGTLIRRLGRMARLRGRPARLVEAAAERWRWLAHELLGRANVAPLYPLRSSRRSATIAGFTRPFDALFVAGGGDLNDVFPEALWRCCCLIGAFAAAGKPVFLSGQQIGPVRSVASERMLRAALQRVTYLGVRDPGESWHFCERAGLRSPQVAMLGDDSLGLAPAGEVEVLEVLHEHRLQRGRFVAVNVRIGAYVTVDQQGLQRVARLLATVQRETELPLLAVPISVAAGDSDLESARLLGQQLEGADFRVLQTASLSAALLKGVLGAADSAVGMSHHFCTFALSQGVPALALHAGDYYAQKASGLSLFWGDQRLAQPIDALDDAAIGRALDLLGDDALRQHLRDRASRVARAWETGFERHVVAPLRSRVSTGSGATPRR
jgi:polysaccharide pyruvyl transferase WcaK-like protein